MSNIAYNIRRYRMEQNLTHQQVADALGVNRSLISHYESGMTAPSVARLKQLADLFKVTMDDLHGC